MKEITLITITSQTNYTIKILTTKEIVERGDLLKLLDEQKENRIKCLEQEAEKNKYSDYLLETAKAGCEQSYINAKLLVLKYEYTPIMSGYLDNSSTIQIETLPLLD